jgi:hypothetical protein
MVNRGEFAALEYPPQEAGEIAGYSHVYDLAPETGGGKRVILAFGRIGIHGARVISPSDMGPAWGEGFEDGVTVSCAQDEPGGPVDVRVIDHPNPGASGVLRTYASGGVWSLTGPRIVGSLKRQLTAHQVLDAVWPGMYYSAALVAAPDTILVDPAMTGHTGAQQVVAEHIHELLQQCIGADTQMRTSLTVFGSLRADQVESTFEASRREVNRLEMMIADRLTHSLTGRLYPAPSFGRTWPYMDATEADPAKAYGQELQALKKRGVAVPMASLTEELRSFQARQEVVAKINQRLMRLATLEQAATR